MTRRGYRAGACALAVLFSGCISQSGSSDDDKGADAAVVDAAAGDQGVAPPDAQPAVDDAAPDAAPVDAAPPPPPACHDEDDLAPNQTPDRARPVEPGFSRDDLYLCANSEDWFRVTLMRGQVLDATLHANPSDADLDLAVTDAAGMVLQESISDLGDEHVQITAPADGDYLVHVTGYRDIAARYALSLASGCHLDSNCPDGQACDPVAGECKPAVRHACGNDGQEPNDTDGQASAVQPGGAPVEGVICGDDRDWFVVDIEDGTSLDVLVSFDAGQDVDVYVQDAETGLRIGQAIGDAQTNPERLSFAHLPGGRYLVGLLLSVPAGQSGTSDVHYRLEIAGHSGHCAGDRDCNDLTPACDLMTGTCHGPGEPGTVPLGGRCTDDVDCAMGADGCFTGAETGADNFCTVVCMADRDCADLGEGAYCFAASRRQSICETACHGDADCSRESACHDGRCQSRGTCLRDADCGDGEYCETQAFGPTVTHVCAATPPPADCGHDAGDPNDLAAMATAITAGQQVDGLKTCDGDRDWYRVTVPAENAGDLLSVHVNFAAGVDLDVYLNDADGNPVGVANGSDGNVEIIEAHYIAPGDYFILVNQFASDSLQDTPYSLVANVVANDDHCTPAGNECGATNPLRSQCDEMTGACSALNGHGMVALGDHCDSNDDCVGMPATCFTSQGGSTGLNICTQRCNVDGDCAQVHDTTCQQVPGSRQRLCLPH